MDKDGKTYYWDIDRIMWLILGLGIAVGLIWLCIYLRDALLPFIVACALAYLMNPLVGLNMKLLHLKGRIIASVLTVTEVTIVIGVLVWAVTPSVISDLEQCNAIIKELSTGKIKLPEDYGPVFNFINTHLDIDKILHTISNMRFESIVNKGYALLAESAEVIIHTIEWLLTLVYILFILIDYPTIVNGFKKIFPIKYRPKAMEITNDVKNNMNHYFRGQGKVALCAIVFYCVGFLIIGLPLAVPMGILVGVLYMIPYFQYITLIPVALICFVFSLGGEFTFWGELGKCGLVYLISQCLCDYVITPHVMGKELGLNPAIILLSLSVWGSLMGIIGMIIALPATALIMSYYETYVSNRK